MLTLPTNIPGQLFKLLFLGFSCWMLYALIADIIPDAPKDRSVWLVYFLVAMSVMLVGSVLGWCAGIIHVRFDPVAGTLRMRRWWSTTTVPVVALANYHAVRYVSGRSGPIPPGWILETSAGRRFELAPSNLQDLPLLEAELITLGVPRGKQVVKH